MEKKNTMKTASQVAETPDTESSNTKEQSSQLSDATQQTVEVGGRKGPEPTRYGDWEKNGRCIDF